MVTKEDVYSDTEWVERGLHWVWMVTGHVLLAMSGILDQRGIFISNPVCLTINSPTIISLYSLILLYGWHACMSYLTSGFPRISHIFITSMFATWIKHHLAGNKKIWCLPKEVRILNNWIDHQYSMKSVLSIYLITIAHELKMLSIKLRLRLKFLK